MDSICEQYSNMVTVPHQCNQKRCVQLEKELFLDHILTVIALKKDIFVLHM